MGGGGLGKQCKGLVMPVFTSIESLRLLTLHVWMGWGGGGQSKNFKKIVPISNNSNETVWLCDSDLSSQRKQILSNIQR